MTYLRYLGIAGLILFSAAYCFIGNGYEIHILSTLGLITIVGVGLNILMGMVGQVSLGHAGFYAIGAYTCAILTVTYNISFWVAFPLAGILAGAVGTVLALPALRVRGPYLAMITIAFGFIVEHGAIEWREMTGGQNGIMNIPKPSIFGYTLDERGVALLIVAVTVIMVFLYYRLARSRWGLALRAVRGSEVAAESLGLSVVAIHTMAFMLSAVAAGLAGALFAPLNGFVSPGSFPFFLSIQFLLVVIVGGSGIILGPLLGAAVVVLLPEFLAFLAEYRLLFFGGLLLVVMWVTPDGIAGAILKRFRKPDLHPVKADGKDILDYIAKGAKSQDLTIEDLCISFGGVCALDGVGLKALPGHVTSIIGPNGAGKTTVLNLMCGFYKPDDGMVNLGERDCAKLPPYTIARGGIARTYQTTQLFDNMTVLDNLLIALRRGRLGSVLNSLFIKERDSDLRRTAENLLAFVGYTGPGHIPAGDLPHVDKRLVEIARALAMQPQVLLLDEPAAGLGHKEMAGVSSLIKRIADAGITVVLVEHHMNLVMRISDHIMVLDAGTCISAGKPVEVRNDPAVLKAYLGESGVKGRPRAAPRIGKEESVLSVTKLGAAYGAVTVLKDVELGVEKGEFVAVLGANGAGKSTLMRAISGLHRPVKGAVLLIGLDITSFGAHRIAGQGLFLVPEGRQVFPELTVIDNLRMGAYSRKDFDSDREIKEMLDRFPALRERQNNRAGLLSGGEQQMLAIARGLIARPKILLLDEPSLGLAPTIVNTLFSVLADLRDEGITILLVDQMAGLALSVADRGYVLQAGRVVHEGPAAAMQNDPEIERAYLGTVD
jgi:ABC-type branched-subunit amino acid transport system ATPase component/ABC-type branched-subunit amino acid transport system permease subunit